MSLNWKEIDAVLSELDLEGVHIQKVKQPDFHSIVFDLYAKNRRDSLYVSLLQGKTRLHTLSHGIKPKIKLQRFAQLLRSRIQGGKIIEARQIGEERIVLLGVVHAGVMTKLWIRLWGGAANIIATDEDDTIIDAFYRRPKREEVSGATFNPVKTFDQYKQGSKRTYEVRDFPGEGSLNRRVEAYYADLENTEELEKLRSQRKKQLERERTKAAKTVSGLERKRKNEPDPESLRRIGDLLAANIHRIPPGGKWVRVEDFFSDGEEVDIELDPTVKPGENPGRYYERYKKASRRLEHINNEIENLSRRIDEIDEELKEIENADSFSELPESAKRVGKQQQPNDRAEERLGLRYSSGGFAILVGRSAEENDSLLRHYVKGRDLWLHARDYPGGYVFIRSIPGKSVPLDVLLDAGNLAVFYSKARSSGKADLYYTEVKYLRRPKEGKKGLVLPTQEKNLSVELDNERIDRLFARRESM